VVVNDRWGTDVRCTTKNGGYLTCGDRWNPKVICSMIIVIMVPGYQGYNLQYSVNRNHEAFSQH